MRVLIVDDEPVNRLVLAQKLRLWGHEPVQAVDGAEAWEMFQSEPFRMVITDWMMPEMDGIELTRRIRFSPQGGYTYVLLLTARSGVEALVEGIERRSADDFVTKPFQTEELRARLRAGERVLQLESDLAEHNRRLERPTTRRDGTSRPRPRMQHALLSVTGAHAGRSSVRPGASFRRASWPATCSTCTRSTTRERRSTCSTSRATACHRRCCRSR